MKIKKILTSLIAASMLFSSAITYVSAQNTQDLPDNTSSVISNEEKIPEIPVIKDKEKEETVDIQDETLKKVEARCCPTTSVSFTKRDVDTNAPLEGATFKLYHKILLCDSWDEKQNCTTTADGKISFRNLSFGYYKIEETTPPSGYIKSGGAYEFNITIFGTNNFSQSSAENMFKNKKNPFPKTISFTKMGLKDDNEVPLENAQFGLYRANETDLLTTDTSKENGLVSFTIPSAGDYTIKETLAPDNYTVVTAPYSFTLDENGDTNFDREAVETHFINVYEEQIPVFPKTISFTKMGLTTDNKLIPLSGAKFMLTKKDNPLPCIAQPNPIAQQEPVCILAPEPVTSTSGSDGKVSFEITQAGSYIIEEVSAPTDYTVSTGKFEFTINEMGDVSYTAEQLKVVEKNFINTRIITPPTPPIPPYTPTVSYGEAPIELIPYIEIITISEPAPAPPVSMPPKTGDTTLPIAIPTAMLLLATAMLIIKRKLAKEE